MVAYLLTTTAEEDFPPSLLTGLNSMRFMFVHQQSFKQRNAINQTQYQPIKFHTCVGRFQPDAK